MGFPDLGSAWMHPVIIRVLGCIKVTKEFAKLLSFAVIQHIESKRPQRGRNYKHMYAILSESQETEHCDRSVSGYNQREIRCLNSD